MPGIAKSTPALGESCREQDLPGSEPSLMETSTQGEYSDSGRKSQSDHRGAPQSNTSQPKYLEGVDASPEQTADGEHARSNRCRGNYVSQGRLLRAQAVPGEGGQLLRWPTFSGSRSSSPGDSAVPYTLLPWQGLIHPHSQGPPTGHRSMRQVSPPRSPPT